MKIRWYYPSFWSFGDNPPEAESEFANLAAFLELPRIRHLMAQEDFFDHWEISPHHPGTDVLLLIDKQQQQWVIGYLPDNHGFDFPVWKAADAGVTFRLTRNKERDAPVVEIWINGKFRASLYPGGADQQSVCLISMHLAAPPSPVPGFPPAWLFDFRP